MNFAPVFIMSNNKEKFEMAVNKLKNGKFFKVFNALTFDLTNIEEICKKFTEDGTFNGPENFYLSMSIVNIDDLRFGKLTEKLVEKEGFEYDVTSKKGFDEIMQDVCEGLEEGISEKSKELGDEEEAIEILYFLKNNVHLSYNGDLTALVYFDF